MDHPCRVVVVAVTLSACITLTAGGQAPPPQAFRLGDVIPLENTVAVAATLEPRQGGTVAADANQQTIPRGVEVRLTFTTTGTEPVQDILVVAGLKPEMSNIVLVQPKGKRRTPQAIMHAGEKLGYRTLAVPGGMMITGGCIDNSPVGLNTRDGAHIGLGCMFCVEPEKKDEIVVMFREADVKPGSTLLLKGCTVCPKTDVLIRLD